MRNNQKLERQLRVLESELRSRLLESLPEVALSGSPLFFSSELDPHGLSLAHLHPESERILQAAKSCVDMRAQLGLSVVGSVGDLFLSACRESASLGDAHRRGPRRLASWLLAELGAG